MRYLKVFEKFNKRKFDELELDDIEDFLMGVVDERKLSISELVKYDKEKKPAFLYNKYCIVTHLYNTESKPSTYELTENPLICFKVFIPYPNCIRNSSFDIDGYTKSILEYYLKRIYNHYDVDMYLHTYENNFLEEFISKSFVIIAPKNGHRNISELSDYYTNNEPLEEIEDYFLELMDHSKADIPINVDVKRHLINKSEAGFKIEIFYDMYDQVYVKNFVTTAILRLKRNYNIHHNHISKTGNGHNAKDIPVYDTDRTSRVYDPIWKQTITISPKKINENSTTSSNLIVVDVQKSFKKFFTDKYVSQLQKYCNQFSNVYQIWDNHVDGTKVDKDYLYDKNEEDKDDHHDLYDFPNQTDTIEKRYNYDVDVDFYRKILSKKTYKLIKSKEGNLKRGESFYTNEGTIIVYVGNNHQWHHLSKKLFELFKTLKGKEVTIVGGSNSECLEDIYIAGISLGVNIKKNMEYIYSATHCPIK